MNDPLNPGQRAVAEGGAALKRGGAPRWELADVLAYSSSTHTAFVRTHTGRPLRGVPQIKNNTRSFEHLKTGTTVVVSYDLGFPAIIGVISFVGPPQTAIDAPTLTGIPNIGADNPLQPVDNTANYCPPDAPTDMTQGDWAVVGTMGNHVAVLEGGISSLGSPTALVRSLGMVGLLQIIAQRMQTVTEFGQWSVTNDNGRTSFTLRAGSNTLNQTGRGEEHWTIRLDLGATGDVFNFEITDLQGKTLFKFHVGPDGRVQIYGDGGVDLSSGQTGNAETLQDISGSRTNNIGADDALKIDGARQVSIGKTLKESVGTDRASVVGQSDTRFVQKDRTTAVGGQQTEVFTGGSATDAKPGRYALTTKLVNGGWMIDIGNPADGANISAEAAFVLKTSLGEISLNSGASMKLHARQIVDIDGTLIKAGGDHPMPLFDTYLTDEAALWTLVSSALDTGTATGPIIGWSAAKAAIQAYIAKLQAQRSYLSQKCSNG